MTFFVEKKLHLGSIRFGVGRRRVADTIDQETQLSTGGNGEFIRRRNEGFYFGGHDRFNAPTLPEAQSIRSTPFWTSLSTHKGLVALAAVGGLLVLLGLGVVASKGAQGWVEVILGLIVAGIPVVLTAQERGKIVEQEERARAEREEAENRKKAMLAGYTAALERVEHDHSEEALQRLVDEHPDLPYNLWSPSARRIVLLIGFHELEQKGIAGSAEVARIMDRVSRAAGLTPEHATAVKVDLYDAIVWHLLADDRLGPTQQKELAALRQGLSVTESDLPEDTLRTMEQFERLRGVTSANVPRAQCTQQLGFKEYCIHQTQSDQGLLHVTSKQLIQDGKKRHAYSMPALADITVIADEDAVGMRDTSTRKELRYRVQDPIYTAAMIDLAGSIDERPKGFA